jgi:hypothetical protein
MQQNVILNSNSSQRGLEEQLSRGGPVSTPSKLMRSDSHNKYEESPSQAVREPTVEIKQFGSASNRAALNQGSRYRRRIVPITESVLRPKTAVNTQTFN